MATAIPSKSYKLFKNLEELINPDEKQTTFIPTPYSMYIPTLTRNLSELTIVS